MDSIKIRNREKPIRRGIIYSRVPSYLALTNKILLKSNKDQIQNLQSILSYLNSTHFNEIRQFGIRFPFQKFLMYTHQKQYEPEGQIAFQILSIVTYSGIAEDSFFMNEELFDLCNSYIFDPNYTKYALQIICDAAYRPTVTDKLLSADIFDVLNKLPITYESAVLVSALSLYQSNKLPEILNQVTRMIDDQLDENKNQISGEIAAYSIKSLYHIYNWEQSSAELCNQIHSQYKQKLYYLFSVLLASNESFLLNAVFRYLSYVSDIPHPLVLFILERIASYNELIIDRNIKTVILGMSLFDKNSSTWCDIPELPEKLLKFISSALETSSYKLKQIFFKILLGYYSFSNDDKHEFLAEVADLYSQFLEECDCKKQVLQELVSIAKLNDPKINSIISSYDSALNKIAESDTSDDTIVNLSIELLNLLAADQ